MKSVNVIEIDSFLKFYNPFLAQIQANNNVSSGVLFIGIHVNAQDGGGGGGERQ